MMSKLMPVERLALHILGWTVVTALAFFFHPVGFIVCFLILASRTLLFMFVYENTKNARPINTPKEESYVRLHDSGESDRTSGEFINEPFPELGAEWRERLPANVSEGESRWDKRVLG